METSRMKLLRSIVDKKRHRINAGQSLVENSTVETKGENIVWVVTKYNGSRNKSFNPGRRRKMTSINYGKYRNPREAYKLPNFGSTNPLNQNVNNVDYHKIVNNIDK